MQSVQARFQGSRPLILDGGLATELEARGHDLPDALWSARLLVENPSAIIAVHEAYLRAGAQCLITASYQATLTGLMAKGLSRARARDVLASSVELARQAIEKVGTLTDVAPLVVASIGPYGAALANGAEFHGIYDIAGATLHDFHAQRFEILAEQKPDLFACETIPSLEEAEILCSLLDRYADIGGWITFSCRDEGHTCHGEPIEECAARLEDAKGVVAMGINCTHPAFVLGLIERIKERTTKPIVVYPNSGQAWDADNRRWIGEANVESFATLAYEWRRAGAGAIGGCCQTGPEHIQQLAQAFC